MSEPNDTGYGNYKRHDEVLSAAAIGFRCARKSCREEHAERHVQIPQNLGIAGQGIGQEDIPKFAMLWFRQSTDNHSSQRQKEVAASFLGVTSKWQDNEDEEDDNVRLGDEVQELNESSRAMGSDPEYNKRDDERKGQDSRQTVSGGMMGRLLRRMAGRVSDQRRDVLDTNQFIPIQSISKL